MKMSPAEINDSYAMEMDAEFDNFEPEADDESPRAEFYRASDGEKAIAEAEYEAEMRAGFNEEAEYEKMLDYKAWLRDGDDYYR